MLIAHLPSGYILGRFAQKRRRGTPGIMIAAPVGSVIPDIDMLYFHFVDGGRTHHHAYFTHWPHFWVATGLLALVLAKWRAPQYLAMVGAFFAAAMMHMVLDTVASPIPWLMAVRPAEGRIRHRPGHLSQLGHELCPALDIRPRTSHMCLGAGAWNQAIAA